MLAWNPLSLTRPLLTGRSRAQPIYVTPEIGWAGARAAGDRRYQPSEGAAEGCSSEIAERDAERGRVAGQDVEGLSVPVRVPSVTVTTTPSPGVPATRADWPSSATWSAITDSSAELYVSSLSVVGIPCCRLLRR
jgi:hypothetical protein